MYTRFISICTILIDFIAPPRRTEQVVREITLSYLEHAANREGCLPYQEPLIAALVWELKYYANSHAAALAGTFISEQLIAFAADELGVPLLIPIPMHPTRRRERGYNQTELLCEQAITKLGGGFQYLPQALERVKNTPQQQGLARQVRLKNVKNSMQVTHPHLIRGRVCVVVDDVTTTGATLDEAARALRRAGAHVVHKVALAQS